MAIALPATEKHDPVALQRLLDGRYADVRPRLSGPRCKAITGQVNDLCNQLRAQAGALVDAFGVPDTVLAAPIGLRHPSRPTPDPAGQTPMTP